MVLNLKVRRLIPSELSRLSNAVLIFVNETRVSLFRFPPDDPQPILDDFGPWQTRHFINECHRTEPPTRRDHDVERQP